MNDAEKNFAIGCSAMLNLLILLILSSIVIVAGKDYIVQDSTLSGVAALSSLVLILRFMLSGARNV